MGVWWLNTKRNLMNNTTPTLNESACVQPTDLETPKLAPKPSAATSKANGLTAQENTLASAGVGSALFRSAKDFLADIPKPRGYKEEVVSAVAASTH
jgi:hypothetical protein